jgi:RND superfamily putative drug exporter
MTKNTANDLEHRGFRFFAAVGRFCVRFKWLVLIFWIVATFASAHYLPSLTDVTQSSNTAFLPASSPSEKALNLESAFESSNATTIPVVVATSSGAITTPDESSIALLQSNLSKVPQVLKVVDRGRSADGQADIVEVQASNVNGQNPTAFIQALKDAITKSGLPSGLQAHLTGPLAVQVDNSKGSGKQNTNLQIGTVIFIVILLLLIFKAPLAPFVTLIPPVLVVTAAGPIVAEASKHGLKVSSLAQLLLTVLVLGAGTDYGLFLIFRVREELADGLDSKEAIVKALSRVGESITFSAATVVAALLSLLLATFQIYSNLGIPLAIGITLMLLAGLTLLPALLAIFGRAVFWPAKNKKSRRFGIWGSICARVVQYPVPVLIIGLLFFGGLATAVHGYQAGGFGGDTAPPAKSDSAEGAALEAKHFPDSNTNPTEILFVLPNSVWQDPAPILKAQTELSSAPEFTKVSGALNPNGSELSTTDLTQLYKELGPPASLPAIQQNASVSPKLYQAYRATANYISSDGKTIQYAVGLSVGDPTTTAAMKNTPAVRSRVSKVASSIGAANNGVIGESSAFYDISSISNSDLMRVVPVAVLVIGLILGLLMRSLVAPIYLVASVVLSYLAALGMAVILFIYIGKESGIVFILPFLMFMFLLALGEDYNILVMTRIKEEAHSLPLKKAVTQALNTTGTTVTSAGLVLAGTFSVLAAVSTGPSGQQVRDIGIGLAIGILMDTFLVRTLLVPSIVVLLGKWNWWPSKHGSWIDQE